jgi:oligoendopeptidase F
VVREGYTSARLSYFHHTNNALASGVYREWTAIVHRVLNPWHIKLLKMARDSGGIPHEYALVAKRWNNELALRRGGDVSVHERLATLRASYQRLMDSIRVPWNGSLTTIPLVSGHLDDQRREIREAAFRSHLSAVWEHRHEFARIFDEMLGLRQQIAHDAGYANYRDYAHVAMHRFEYSVTDCQRWRRSIESVVVPVVQRLADHRRSAMHLKRLRPWDVDGLPDLNGRLPLRPYTSEQDLLHLTGSALASIHPRFGQYFDAMRAQGLLDVSHGSSKRSATFCATLDYRGLPFIFMNAVGMDRDVTGLLHECGHAVATFELVRAGRDLFQRELTSEVTEMAAMTVELLGGESMSRGVGGFYDGANFSRARANHLESIIYALTRIAAADEVQEWIYTAPEGAYAEARETRWFEIRTRFQPGVDWSELEDYRRARWYLFSHFFHYPFSYIEYGLAQIAALQIWRNYLRAPRPSVRDFRRALSLGAGASLAQTYATAGAEILFDAESIRPLIELVEAKLHDYYAAGGGARPSLRPESVSNGAKLRSD